MGDFLSDFRRSGRALKNFPAPSNPLPHKLPQWALQGQHATPFFMQYGDPSNLGSGVKMMRSLVCCRRGRWHQQTLVGRCTANVQSFSQIVSTSTSDPASSDTGAAAGKNRPKSYHPSTCGRNEGHHRVLCNGCGRRGNISRWQRSVRWRRRCRYRIISVC